MTKLGKILTWSMAFFFLPGLVGCGEGELEFSGKNMSMEHEQGRFDPACADLNVDGCVDVNDLNILIDAWGAEIACLQACGGCPDINTDGLVGGADLSLLLVAWGYGESCGDDNADSDADISDGDVQADGPTTDAGASDNNSDDKPKGNKSKPSTSAAKS
ncbi:MAG: hypothetical protein QGI45_11710 [Myxococcota bacterium]|nr:hypothetical protein [Myxococcota bacterium]